MGRATATIPTAVAATAASVAAGIPVPAMRENVTAAGETGGGQAFGNAVCYNETLLPQNVYVNQITAFLHVIPVKFIIGYLGKSINFCPALLSSF